MRITNPKIPALPSRAERMQTEQRTPDNRSSSRSSMRGNEGPQGERPNPDVQNPRDSIPAERGGGRILTTPGTNRTPRGSSGNSDTGAGTAPAARPDSNPPSTQRSTPVWRYDGRPPQQQQAPQPPSETAPRNEKQNNRAERRSEEGAQGNTNGRVIVIPAPRADNPPPYVAPRQSAPSNERNGGGRTNVAPSNNRSGAEQAPSSPGRPSGGGTPGRDDGGGAQKAPDRDSSRSGGGRR